MKPKSAALHKKISMTRKEFIDEHEKLTRALKTGKGLKGELKEQGEELRKVKKG